MVSDCHLPYFSSFQFTTKWGKPNLLSKQLPGTALFLSACLQLPHIARSEQDMLSFSPPERVPTPMCALSLSLGEWWWLTPCSGDKF